MRVRILEDTEYAPVAGDARSCFGQLATRASVVDGKVGPMACYFRKGRTPELRDEIAADFIARGVAVPFDGEQVVEVSRDEILELAVRTCGL